MSVTQTVTLPDQPVAGGVVHRTPLGGDGYTAPMASYIVDNMLLTSSATGGASTIQINMDERFCSLVAYLTLSVSQAIQADIEVRYRLDTSSVSSPVATQVQNRDLPTITWHTAEINDIWTPVPNIIPGDGSGGLVSAAIENLDTDAMRVSALIYLFNIRVREVMPMGPLLWARGST